MLWNKKTDTLHLSESDMRVLAQCDAPAGEIFKDRRNCPDIPPLWSVLSYVLLQETNRTPAQTWRCYRKYLELAEHRDFHYYDTQIPKASGGMRKIAAPSSYLDGFQREIGRTILQYLPVSPHAYAYRKGVNIRQCAEPHRNQDVLFHLDIQDFFGTISEAMVARRLREDTGYSKSLCLFLAKLCCYRGYLPQGATTSPMLSNIVFRPCDEALAQLAEQFGLQYTRYSDDMFFSGSAGVDRSKFLEQVEYVLSRKAFRLNRLKTKVLGRQHCQKVLGITVNQHLQVSRKYRRKLLQEVYYLERFGQDCDSAVHVRYETYLQQLEGKLAYALSVNPDDEKLQQAKTQVAYKLFRYLHGRN